MRLKLSSTSFQLSLFTTLSYSSSTYKPAACFCFVPSKTRGFKLHHARQNPRNRSSKIHCNADLHGFSAENNRNISSVIFSLPKIYTPEPYFYRLNPSAKEEQEEVYFAETNCSITTSFQSFVFIIQELQRQAMSIREALYRENLELITSKVNREMNSSFVWLFQQIFSRTPTLMVHVMLLVANFSVFSMSETATEAPRQLSELDPETETASVDYPFEESVSLQSNDFELTTEELCLWDSFVEEAMRMKSESMHVVLDNEMVQNMVANVRVEIQESDYEEYSRRDLMYQIALSQEPTNPLLLCNYGQFLCVVARDYNRAEECFKGAVMTETPDAEALIKYADFLWEIRNDLWEAEQRYEQAACVGGDDPYYASKYAHFLWNTGGEETCYPLSSVSQDQNS